MKRDMDLVRRILIAVEENDAPYLSTEEVFPDVAKVPLMYHIKLLIQVGWITAMDWSSATDEDYSPGQLTWTGHEFLDSIRSDSVWNKVKQTVAEKGGAIPLALVQELAISFGKSALGLS